jgi:hypothetical protein
VAATSQLAIEIDDLQQRFREGPCLDAAIGNPMVMCNDLREAPPWPRFAEAVAAAVHSLMSFQLYTHNARMGAMNHSESSLTSSQLRVKQSARCSPPTQQSRSLRMMNDFNFSPRWQAETSSAKPRARSWNGSVSTRSAHSSYWFGYAQNSNIRLAVVAEELVSRGPEPIPRNKTSAHAQSDQQPTEQLLV